MGVLIFKSIFYCLKIFFLHIFTSHSFSNIRYLRYPPDIDNLNKAKHCYQSITDDKLFLSTRFHPKFSDAPKFLNADLRINIKLQDGDPFRISAFYYLKLINKKCESTFEISDLNFRYLKMMVEIHFYSNYKTNLMAWLQFDILPNHEKGIKAFWDKYFILMVFINSTSNKKTIPERTNLTKNDINNYFKDFSTSMKYACVVLYNKGFVFEYKLINANAYIPIYNAIKITAYIFEELILEYEYAAWPCSKPDISTKKLPTFIFSNSPSEYNVYFRLKGFKKMPYDEFRFILKNKIYKRMYKPNFVLKHKYIYLTGTNIEDVPCMDGTYISIRTTYEKEYILDAYKTVNETFRGFINYYQSTVSDLDKCL